MTEMDLSMEFDVNEVLMAEIGIEADENGEVNLNKKGSNKEVGSDCSEAAENNYDAGMKREKSDEEDYVRMESEDKTNLKPRLSGCRRFSDLECNDDTPSRIITLQTSRGNISISLDGYEYRKKKANKNSINWECLSENCKGRLSTDKDHRFVRSFSEHTCLPDPARIEVKKAVLNTRKRVREEDVNVAQIYKEEIEKIQQKLVQEGLDTTVLVSLPGVPSFRSIKSTLYRERQALKRQKDEDAFSDDSKDLDASVTMKYLPRVCSTSRTSSRPRSTNQFLLREEEVGEGSETDLVNQSSDNATDESGGHYYKCSRCLVIFESVKQATEHAHNCQPPNTTSSDVEVSNIGGKEVSEDDLKKKRWMGTEVMKLLQAVKKHLNQFRDGLIPHKTVWEIIADEIGMSGQSYVCDLKFRNMKKTFRKILESNRTKDDGTPHINWEFFNLMEEIMKIWEPRIVNKRSFHASNGGTPQPNGSTAQTNCSTSQLNGSTQFEFEPDHSLVLRDSSQHNDESEEEYEPSETKMRRSTPAWFQEYMVFQRQCLDVRRKSIELRIQQHSEKMKLLNQISHAILACQNNKK